MTLDKTALLPEGLEAARIEIESLTATHAYIDVGLIAERAITAYLAALRSIPPDDGWRTIDSAPTSDDGKLRVLVFDPTQKVRIDINIADGDWWRNNAKSRGPWTAPTHWRPLPPPPEAV